MANTYSGQWCLSLSCNQELAAFAGKKRT